MSDPASPDRLRPGALAMLADGNSIEAVAHLMAVPVDTVRAWQDGREAAAAPDAAPPAPARHASPRVRFDDELEHAMPKSSRLVVLVLCGLIAVVGGGFAISLLRDGHVVNALQVLMVVGLGIWSLGRMVPPSLVLGTDSVTVPKLFGGHAMAYSDIASYTIVPRKMWLDLRSGVPGRLLALRSRRPGAAPLEAFIADGNPVDRRIFERLDEAVEANRHAPALPAAPGRGVTATGAAAIGWMPYAAIAVLGAVQLWPIFSVSLRQLAHATPPASALLHVEGQVAGASRCWQRSKRNNSGWVSTVTLARPGGHEDVNVPCLGDPMQMTRGGPHHLAVDLDPEAWPVPFVYQVSLDGRTLQSYEEGRSRQRVADVPAMVGVAMPLLVVGVIVGAPLMAARRRQRRAWPA